MSRLRVGMFVAAAVLAAALFVRLGVWQLHRRQERRARNALVLARLASPPVDPLSLPRDTASARFRRVQVDGTPDYAHELVYTARTHDGAPGVNLLTPVRLPNSDTAVLVDRGWVYSPDGATVDLGRWVDHDSSFVGYAEELPSGPGATYSGRSTVISRLSYQVVANALPYPVLPFVVVALGSHDTTNAARRVARLTVPALDEGPHLNYAIQWFSFAAISLVGVGIVIRQSRRDARQAPSPRAGRGPAGDSRDVGRT